ncbi:hypothetical protein HDU84_008638 [Entophlyctis sp. JEL0112]|nr:hypothetical protein HDU84_008638 [Entophlyctis sp. JEL0112]
MAEQGSSATASAEEVSTDPASSAAAASSTCTFACYTAASSSPSPSSSSCTCAIAGTAVPLTSSNQASMSTYAPLTDAPNASSSSSRIPSTSMNSQQQPKSQLGQSITTASMPSPTGSAAGGVASATPSSTTTTVAFRSTDLTVTIPANILFGSIGAGFAVLLIAAIIGVLAFRRYRRRQRRRDALASAAGPPQWVMSGNTSTTAASVAQVASSVNRGDAKKKGPTSGMFPRRQRPVTLDALQRMPSRSRTKAIAETAPFVPDNSYAEPYPQFSQYPPYPVPPSAQLMDPRQMQMLQRQQAAELQRQLWASAYSGSDGWYFGVPANGGPAYPQQLVYQPQSAISDLKLQDQQQKQEPQYQVQSSAVAYSNPGSGRALVDRYGAASLPAPPTSSPNAGNSFPTYNYAPFAPPDLPKTEMKSNSRTDEQQEQPQQPRVRDQTKLKQSQADATPRDYERPAGRASLRRKQMEEMEEMLSQAITGDGGVGGFIDRNSFENRSGRGSPTQRPNSPQQQSRNTNRDGASSPTADTRVASPSSPMGRASLRKYGIAVKARPSEESDRFFSAEVTDPGRANTRSVRPSSPSQMLKYVGRVDENGEYHYP